ncbi:MAG: hypothetical protein ACREEM_03405 [Blastocatellia bacterium]
MRTYRWLGRTCGFIFLCLLIGLIGLIGWTTPGLAQSGPKRIYIAPDGHTDYLWSGTAHYVFARRTVSKDWR